MAEANEIIHQSVRLQIMSALIASSEPLEFTRLKAVARATDGNLGAHLNTLEKAGYVNIHKDFVGKKPRTRASITRAGRHAFQRHIEYLRDIVDTHREA
ncbi:MAG TPA: transcriptional regulator [Caulobacterales bacterium]|nr:transcriptional regulator [Caulobacterales bacterium]